MFEALIEGVTTPQALKWMTDNKYTTLIIQYGKGAEPKLPNVRPNLDIIFYDFKASLESDMQAADLILSHAGAGTVMEALRMKKKMVVIINTILMHNHQTELANAMGERKHLFVVEAPELLQNPRTWDLFERFQPVPKDPGDENDFPRLMNSFLGFPTKES